MTESGDGDERPRSLLAECIVDPAGSKRRLPAVLGLLEADDEVTRLAATWTCCLVAVDDPTVADYVVDRLVHRLDRVDHEAEITSGLAWLSERYPDVVADAVERSGGSDRHGVLEATSVGPGAWPPTPTPIGQPTRPGVGRVTLPDASGADDPRSTYIRGTPDPEERPASAATDEETPGRAASSGTGVATDDEVAGSGTSVTDDGLERRSDREASIRETADVSTIARRSSFDRLHVLATRDRSRYSEDFRALVGSHTGEERAITLRLLSAPDGMDERARFDATVGEVLAEWDAVEAHSNVVSVLDWDVEPRPWLATSVAGESLATVEDLDPSTALSDAIDLADALAHLHRNDVVHAGIDPGNVDYPGDAFDGNEQEPPLLNNVGLVGRLRHVQNPASLLDPRYAAPEYFDRRFGAIDAATDVYQLGAVVFRRFTGRPPVEGSFAEVRDAVTSPSSPVPSEVADVPPGLDEVLAKALATQKLTRYETVEHFQQDLRTLEEGEP